MTDGLDVTESPWGYTMMICALGRHRRRFADDRDDGVGAGAENMPENEGCRMSYPPRIRFSKRRRGQWRVRPGVCWIGSLG